MKVIFFLTICTLATVGDAKLFPAAAAVASTRRSQVPSLPPLAPRRTCAAAADTSIATTERGHGLLPPLCRPEETHFAATACTCVATEPASTGSTSARTRGRLPAENARDDLEALHHRLKAYKVLRLRVVEKVTAFNALIPQINCTTACLERSVKASEKVMLEKRLLALNANLRALLADPLTRYDLSKLDAKIAQLQADYDVVVTYNLAHPPEARTP